MNSMPKLPIHRYVEWLRGGRLTGRVAYVTREWDMPEPQPGAEWHPDASFDVANELRARPHLRATLVDAIKNGTITVTDEAKHATVRRARIDGESNKGTET
jgi:hypothetical protein